MALSQQRIFVTVPVFLALHRSPERPSGLQKFVQGRLVTPGVAKATPTCVKLVGFTALHTPGQPLAMNTGGREEGREQMNTVCGSGAPDSTDSVHTTGTTSQSFRDGGWLSTQGNLEEKPKVAVPTELDQIGLNELAQSNKLVSRYRSQLLKPVECTPLLLCTASELSGDPGQHSGNSADQQVPRVYAVAKRSSGKRMRCEVMEEAPQVHNKENSGGPQTLQKRAQSFYDFDSVANSLPTFGSAAKPPLSIRTSKSDYQLTAKRRECGKPGQVFEVCVSTPARIPTSVSHPCFPLSLPHNRLDLKGTPPEGDDQEDDKSTHRFTFKFSNPRPMNAKQRAAMSTDKESNKLPEYEIQFESSRKVSECNEANLLEVRNSPIPSATPQQPCSRTTSSVRSSQDLDEAFLLTPYPGVCRSPNLLEKISLEIAARHKLFPCTPHPLVEASLHVNDSYKQAVLGENYPFPLPEPLSLRFETSDIAVKEEESCSEEEDEGCSEDRQALSILESDCSTSDTVNNHSLTTLLQKASSPKPQSSCDHHRNITEAPRLQPHHPNLPPPPSSSDCKLKSRMVVTSKAHQKNDKQDSHWFGTPSASPRVFGLARKSPWFKGHGPTGQRFCK